MPTRTMNLGDGMAALALGECQTIQNALQHRRDVSESIHEARTAIRRLRSMLAVAELRVDGLAGIDRSLQRLGDGLSTLRDAHVAIAAGREMAKKDDSAPWQPAIEALVRRRDTLLSQEFARDPGFARRRSATTRIERRVLQLDWTPLRTTDVRDALERSQRRAGRAEKRADTEPTPENIHLWRRRTRRLRMQLQVMRALSPDTAKAVAKPSLRKELKTLHKLGDRLGWRQDLEVLRGLIIGMKNVPDRPLLLKQLRATIDSAGSPR